MAAGVTAAAVLFAVAPALAEEPPPAPSAEASAPVPADVPAPAYRKPSLLAAVERAKAELRAELDKRKKAEKEPRVVRSRDVWVDIVLAVWNRETDALTLFEAKKNGTGLKLKTSPGFPIKVAFTNGVNSQYELPPESKSLVVGVIYPVFAETLVKKKKAYELHDVVYVPYSSEFYLPQFLSAGSDYLTFLIKDAFDEMRAKGIRSRAFPDRLVADVIDPYLVKSIAVIEHADARLFARETPERAVGRFLVSLAANQEEAFDFSVSSAGARGLVQFIPSTYALLVKRRPDLELISDFKKGMADHKNAVKAQVALLDSDLAAMPAEIRGLYAADPRKGGEFIAAAYNGGGVRVRRAFAEWGEAWAESRKEEISKLNSRAASLKSQNASLKKQLQKISKEKEKAAKAALAKAQREREAAIARLGVLRKAGLREETVIYVAKLRKAYSMFASGMFATPSAPSGALPEPPRAPAAATASKAEMLICFSEGGCSAMK